MTPDGTLVVVLCSIIVGVCIATGIFTSYDD